MNRKDKRPMSSEEKARGLASARRIYESMQKTSLDLNERERTAEWTAMCGAQNAAIEPLKAQLDANMNSNVLKALWDRNQLFLKQLAQMESSAEQLEAQGRPLLHQNLRAWKHDTESTNTMIQYVLSGRQAANMVSATSAPPNRDAPIAQPGVALDKQALFGIWDMTFTDGRRVELALDDHNTFSYAWSDETIAYWGVWSFDGTSGSSPLLSLTRKGSYPARAYGPLGSKELFYPEHETWTITAAQADKISFNASFMIRRKSIPLPLVTSRISELQTKFKIAEERAASNALLHASQRNATLSAQQAVWNYINSGAGRYRSGRS